MLATTHKDLGGIFSTGVENIIAEAFRILDLFHRQISSSNCVTTRKILYYILFTSLEAMSHLIKILLYLSVYIQQIATKSMIILFRL